MWSGEFEKYQAGLAKKVRNLRSELKLSQEKLALLADVDRTLVSKIERSIANLARCVSKNFLLPQRDS